MHTTTVPANLPVRTLSGNLVQQPPLIRPGDLFRVTNGGAMRGLSTYEFGTNDDFAIRNGYSRWPRTPDDLARPVWAFPHAAVISATPQERPAIRFALEIGAVLNVAGYGWYRLEKDHNDNVKFVAL